MSKEIVVSHVTVADDGEAPTPLGVSNTVRRLAPKGSSAEQIEAAMQMAAGLAQAQSKPKPTRVK